MNKSLVLPRKISPELAEEIGLHIGDGSMNYYRGKGFYQLRGHIIDDQKHYDTRIKHLFKKIYNLNINLRKMPSTSVYGFQVWSNELVAFKNKIGLPLGKKGQIKIPDKILSSKENTKSVIRGIFDTDGCIYLEPKNNKLYPRVEITTISKPLVKQLQTFLEELKFKVTVHRIKPRKRNRSVYYRLSIRGDKMLKKWVAEIKPANPKHKLKFEYYLRK